MSINVQTKPFTTSSSNFIRANYSSNSIASVNKTNVKAQNNTLVDMNYNRLLVKTNKISFTGLPAVIPSLTKKINAAAQILKNDEVLLVGKEIEKSKQLLKESIDSFDEVIKKIFFIEDSTAEGTFAFRKNNRGNHELINLDKENKIHLRTSEGKHYFLDKGQNIYVETGDKIKIQNDDLELSFIPTIEDAEIRTLYVDQLDFSKTAGATIKRFNSNLAEQLQPQKTGASKKRTFADVGGQDAAIAELKKGIIYPLKFPSAYKNSALNHGIILTGGPGTGKSLIAEALANEVDAHYIKLNGLELESKWVGEGEENWRKLFKDATDHQPSIIFIDEFDAVAKARQGSDSSGHSDKIVNQILTLMSDLEKNGDNVFVVAATNKLSLLDSAITRSGRFGKHIPMEKPDLNGCKKILDIHLKNKPVSEKLNLDDFSKDLYTAKASGADIEFIANEAHQNAFGRLKIYEKMENDTFTDADIENLKIEPEDFKKALDDFITQEKTTEESADIAKNTRKEEIKAEFEARQAAEKELHSAKDQKPRNKIGYDSDLYKAKPATENEPKPKDDKDKK